MNLSIEFDGRTVTTHGMIHRTGCRDLRDPERIGEARDYVSACRAADDVTAWAESEGEAPEEYGYQLAPCVKFPVSPAAAEREERYP